MERKRVITLLVFLTLFFIFAGYLVVPRLYYSLIVGHAVSEGEGSLTTLEKESDAGPYVEVVPLEKELPVELEAVDKDKVPEIFDAYVTQNGGNFLVVEGKNLGEEGFSLIVDGSEKTKKEGLFFDVGTQSLFLPVEENFLKEDHRILVFSSVGGESNEFYLEASLASQEPVTVEPKENSPGGFFSGTEENPVESTGAVRKCIVEDILWDANEAEIGQRVGLKVLGSGDCDGQKVKLEVLEVDPFPFSDDVLGRVELKFEGTVARGVFVLSGEVYESQFGFFEGNSLEISVRLDTSSTALVGNVVLGGGGVESGILKLGFGSGAESGSGTGSGGAGGLVGANSPYLGRGCTTAFGIDYDCDGYGIGLKGVNSSTLGTRMLPDADDENPNINTEVTAEAFYGPFSNMVNLKRYLRDHGYDMNAINNIYFVDNANGNDATGAANDITKPFKSFAELVCEGSGCAGGARQKMLLSPGDVVFFRGGTRASSYKIELQSPLGNFAKGASGKPLIIAAFPGEDPWFYGPSSKALESIRISGGAGQNAVSNVIFDGLNFYDWGKGGGIATGGVYFDDGNYSNITFRNSYFYESSRGISFNVSDHGKISNIRFEKIVVNSGGFDASPEHRWIDGMVIKDSLFYIRFGGYNTLSFRGIDGLEFSGNIVHSAGGAGVYIEDGLNNSVFYNNLIFNNGKAAVWLRSTDSSFVTRSRDMRNISFYNNIFWQANQTYSGHKNTIYPTSDYPAVFVSHYNSSVGGKFTPVLNLTFIGNIFVTNRNTSAISFIAGDYPARLLIPETDLLRAHDNIVYYPLGASGNHIPGILAICGWTDGTHNSIQAQHRGCKGNWYQWDTKFKTKVYSNQITNPFFKSSNIANYNAPWGFDFSPTSSSPLIETSTGLVFDLKKNRRYDKDSSFGVEDLGSYENMFCSIGLTAPLCYNQKGVCKGAERVCNSVTGVWDTCSATQYGRNGQVAYEPYKETICDGLDNDCDGLVDEDLNCPPLGFNLVAGKASASVSFGGRFGDNTTVSIPIDITRTYGSGTVGVSVRGVSPSLPRDISFSISKPGTCVLDATNTACRLYMNISVKGTLLSTFKKFDVNVTAQSGSFSKTVTVNVFPMKRKPFFITANPNEVYN
ncbi:right-handed parallel beta-helix repeat-containing protein, partial [Candidatus Pacearchaeota archaeon]